MLDGGVLSTQSSSDIRVKQLTRFFRELLLDAEEDLAGVMREPVQEGNEVVALEEAALTDHTYIERLFEVNSELQVPAT